VPHGIASGDHLGGGRTRTGRVGRATLLLDFEAHDGVHGENTFELELNLGVVQVPQAAGQTFQVDSVDLVELAIDVAAVMTVLGVRLEGAAHQGDEGTEKQDTGQLLPGEGAA
jgi:hypothetical protein